MNEQETNIPSDKAATAGETAMKMTHGIQTIYRGRDGIQREVSVVRWSDDSNSLKFITHWDGDDKEPSVVRIRLGDQAFDALVALALDFSMNRDAWSITDNEAAK